jgi:hypothetical protein
MTIEAIVSSMAALGDLLPKIADITQPSSRGPPQSTSTQARTAASSTASGKIHDLPLRPRLTTTPNDPIVGCCRSSCIISAIALARIDKRNHLAAKRDGDVALVNTRSDRIFLTCGKRHDLR